MVQAVNQSINNIDLENQSTQSINQPTTTDNTFNWKKAAIVAGAGALVTAGGIGAYFATRKPNIDTETCMSSCIVFCKADLNCLEDCTQKNWIDACPTFLNVFDKKLSLSFPASPYDPPTLEDIAFTKEIYCIPDFTPAEGTSKLLYKDMIHQVIGKGSLSLGDKLVDEIEKDILFFPLVGDCTLWTDED